MHDLRAIRQDPDAFKRALAKRNGDFGALVDSVLKLDEQRRAHIQKLQEAQARRNAASKEIGKAKASGDEAAAKKVMDEVASLKTFIQEGEEAERKLDAEINGILLGIPNLPLDDVPVGADEGANKELRKWGEPPKFGFAPKQHFEIGEALGLMDFETAAKISGARFVILKGALARLERAIASFMLDLHTGEFGYTEVLPPALVRDEALVGTGQLPKFEADLFFTDPRGTEWEASAKKIIQTLAANSIGPGQGPFSRDHLDRFLEVTINNAVSAFGLAEFSSTHEFIGGTSIEAKRYGLIPTAEVPLTNLVRESIVAEGELPLRVTAWTPCFRAEAGAAGKDTRGMIRQHQFSKVELVSITTPEQSLEELDRMTQCAEEVLKRLDLPYRTVVLSTGDMGFGARRTHDIEVWLPGQHTYREISSCSVCGDFQARRMNARYRSNDKPKDTRFVHTLNGSGLAVGRTMIAILENFQQADGSVNIPRALVPYMGGLEAIKASRA